LLQKRALIHPSGYSLQLDTTVQENLVQGARNQSRGQSNVRGPGYGHPIPLLPIYPGPNFWNGLFPASEPVPVNAGGNSSARSDGYPSASAYGQPPNFLTGQSGEHRGAYYTPATTTNPLPAAGHSNYPPRAPPAYTASNTTQGEPSAVWQSCCWIERAERDEVRMTIILRRSPPS